VISPSSIYTGRAVVDKLGIKGNMRVCVVNAPRGFIDTLAPPPPGATFSARPAAECDLFLAFAKSRAELFAHFASLEQFVSRQTLWIAWPKKTSGLKTDLDGNIVRETGLADGWVDFKICAIDETWSGLAFKRRK
jgi:hypothetical protein